MEVTYTVVLFSPTSKFQVSTWLLRFMNVSTSWTLRLLKALSIKINYNRTYKSLSLTLPTKKWKHKVITIHIFQTIVRIYNYVNNMHLFNKTQFKMNK